METGLWVLDLLVVAWIGLWAVRQDRTEEKEQNEGQFQGRGRGK